MSPGKHNRPKATEIALGLVLAAASITHVLLTNDLERPRVLLVALSVLTTLPVIWRRTYPFASAMVLAVSLAALLSGDYPEGIAGTYVAVLLSSYSVAAQLPDARLAAVPLAVMLAAGWWDDVRLDHPLGQYASTLVTIGVPWLAGRLVRSHRRQAAELERLTGELEAQRDQMAHAAAVEERSRIARELHDVVAHSISVIAVQAGGARSVLPDQPDIARESIEVVRKTSSEALTEMRRILQVLRGSDAGSSKPQPGVGTLPELVAVAGREGTTVRLSVQEPLALPETLDLNAFRIVQEALTNVRKHAGPGAVADVTIAEAGGWVTIVVGDDGTGCPSGVAIGRGLHGARERAELFGGELVAGNRAGGGYELKARIPLRPTGAREAIAGRPGSSPRPGGLAGS